VREVGLAQKAFDVAGLEVKIVGELFGREGAVRHGAAR
jgi:hypothetical protein